MKRVLAVGLMTATIGLGAHAAEARLPVGSCSVAGQQAAGVYNTSGTVLVGSFRPGVRTSLAVYSGRTLVAHHSGVRLPEYIPAGYRTAPVATATFRRGTRKVGSCSFILGRAR